MKEIRYTLITDGSSDKALIPILTWLLKDVGIDYPIQAEWADLGRLRKPPKTLDEKISKSIELYESNILFIHRDAENQPPTNRKTEIRDAERLVKKSTVVPPIICVIPIRMTESWLLFDENAIRQAAGNPQGKQELNLPRISEVERIPDPKALLKNILSIAGANSKRRRDDNIPIARLADLIEDFKPLKDLTAFQELEKELRNILSSNHLI
jgi:hypothetical protein